jgi:hypothetical protein
MEQLHHLFPLRIFMVQEPFLTAEVSEYLDAATLPENAGTAGWPLAGMKVECIR